MSIPNLWGAVQAVYQQGDALSRQAINAVGGIPAIVNAFISCWAAFLGLRGIAGKVQLIMTRLGAYQKLSSALQKKLAGALEAVIKNI